MTLQQLLDKVEELHQNSQRVIAENPYMDTVSYVIEDLPIETIQQAAEYQNRPFFMLRGGISSLFAPGRCYIHCVSVPCETRLVAMVKQ